MTCASRWTCVVGLALLAACAGTEPSATHSSSAGNAATSSTATDSAGRVANVRYDFEDVEVGVLPAGFTSERTGEGPPGKWLVQEGDGGLHGRVLAQLDGDETEARYPMCIANAVEARDVRASVQFRTVAGEVDQAAGVVVRFRDARTYYMARANALEGNVRFYRIVDGVRKQLASASLRVSGQAWHKLVVEARGSTFRIEYDGTTLFTHEDTTLDHAGKAGVWTKADSVTWFDDFQVESFDAAR